MVSKSVRWNCFAGVLAAILLFCATPAFPGTSIDQTVESWFVPGRDLLEIKSAVDRLAGSKDDPRQTQQIFDALARRLQGEAESARSDLDRLQALRRFVYEAGPWNDNRPFAYDLTDPKGNRVVNQLLSRYLETRKGNCVTMPLLAFMLGRKLGLKMTLASAPLHVFVKWEDERSQMWNLEATSGLGFTRDVWYRKNLPMTDQAVANGIYLKPRTEEQNVVLIATTFVDIALRQRRYADVIAATSVLLRHDPTNAYLMAKRGTARGRALEEEFLPLYGPYESMSEQAKAEFQRLYRLAMADFKAAEALGWTPRDGLQEGE